MKPATTITLVFLGLVCVVHLLRVVFQVDVTVAGWPLPMWMNVVAFLAIGALAAALWVEHKPR